MQHHTTETLKIYYQHIRKYTVSVFVIVASVVSGSAMGVIIPLYFKKFFDILGANGTRADLAVQLVSILITIGLLELVRWLFWRIAVFVNTSVESHVIAELSTYCFNHLHRHSFSFFNNNFVGSLVKRTNWFTRAFESITDKLIWNIIPLITNLSVIITVLTRRSTTLGFIIMGWLVLFLLINGWLTKYKLKFDIQRNEAETMASGLIADTITNNSNVKLFNGFRRESESYTNATDTVRKLRRLTWNLDGIFDGAQGLMVVILEISIFYVAITLWEQGVLSIGDFVLIQSYIIILFENIWNFGKMIRYLYSDLSDAEEMTKILLTPFEIQDPINATQLSVPMGEIDFEHVSFNYNDTRKILKELSLKITPKEKVALVGPSGAGKSTVIKLLLRMHDITNGSIKIDGQKISNVTQESLWKAVSLVPQDPILFHRTLLENIRYGKPDASDDEVIAAAKLAHCHEFISSFPDHYQTYVGERGVRLSGGERQRVAIARAILRNAPILVLDEATSSLDSESESLIQDALTILMRDKTVIVIAHRLSTIMKMDRIIVIQDGEVVEQGTHSALLKKKDGLYRQLWKLQAGGFMQEMPAPTAEEGELKFEAEKNPDVLRVNVIAHEEVRESKPSAPVHTEPQIIM